MLCLYVILNSLTLDVYKYFYNFQNVYITGFLIFSFLLLQLHYKTTAYSLFETAMAGVSVLLSVYFLIHQNSKVRIGVLTGSIISLKKCPNILFKNFDFMIMNLVS